MVDFTYYGDLLGIGKYYKLNKSSAKEKLDNFYDNAYSHFSPLCYKKRVTVEMYSDSIVITGKDATNALKELNEFYIDCLKDGLLLRGAIVNTRLKYESRRTIDGFNKKLPVEDALARAVGLEKIYKGSRLIIENDLAIKLFSNCPQWLTHEGYYLNPPCNSKNVELLRKICPTPDNEHYEMLYYWSLKHTDNWLMEEFDYIEYLLGNLMIMYDDDLNIHHKETIELIERCKQRFSHVTKLKSQMS